MKHCRRLLLLCVFGFATIGCGGGGGGGSSEQPLDQNACGVLGLNTKIINGTPCDPTSSPVVEVQLVFADGNGGVCSGTLIANNFVLTAAHCFLTTPRSVVVGNGTVKSSGTDVYIHPDFGTDPETQNLNNDVAIIKLKNGLPLPTVPVLQSRSVESGDVIAIFGYGLDSSGVLQVLNSGEMRVDSVDTDHIVSIYNGEGSNTCNGDSGGPAMGQTTAGAWGIAGITSTGTSATCSSGDTSVFTNLADPSVFNFIKQIVPSVATN